MIKAVLGLGPIEAPQRNPLFCKVLLRRRDRIKAAILFKNKDFSTPGTTAATVRYLAVGSMNMGSFADPLAFCPFEQWAAVNKEF